MKPRLTPRQLQVVRGMMLGMTDKEVARDLGISPHTVHAHVDKIRDRLGITGPRSALVATLYRVDGTEPGLDVLRRSQS